MRPPSRHRARSLVDRVTTPALVLAVALPLVLLVLLIGEMPVGSRALHASLAAIVAAALVPVGLRLAGDGRTRRDSRAMIAGGALAFATVLLVGEAIALLSSVPADSAVLRAAGLLPIPAVAAFAIAGRHPGAVRPGRELIVMRTISVILAITMAISITWLAMPDLVAPRIGAASPVALVLLAATVLVTLTIAMPATRTALLSRRPLDVTTAVAVAALIPAQAGLALGTPPQAAWVVGHLLMLGCLACMALQLGVDVSRQRSSNSLAGGLKSTALVERSAEFLGARVSSLVDRMMDKDPSTAGHVERVAALAVRMGEELHLSTGRLRLLAAGGLLHDIGKLTVPSAILRKPGRLTDAEFRVIQQHPSAGRRLLAELGGFHELVLELVELHHERMDGTGYPHGHTAEELRVEVRILAVADVFDALTADRPYRRACSIDAAIAEITAMTGTGFDRRCVEALRAVVGTPGQVLPIPASQSRRTAVAAMPSRI